MHFRSLGGPLAWCKRRSLFLQTTRTHVKLSGVHNVEFFPLVSLSDHDCSRLDLLAGDDSHDVGDLLLAHVLEQEYILRAGKFGDGRRSGEGFDSEGRKETRRTDMQ